MEPKEPGIARTLFIGKVRVSSLQEGNKHLILGVTTTNNLLGVSLLGVSWWNVRMEKGEGTEAAAIRGRLGGERKAWGIFVPVRVSEPRELRPKTIPLKVSREIDLSKPVQIVTGYGRPGFIRGKR